MTNLLRVLFWIAVAFDLGAIGLLFVLGLAAAGPSRTNPLAVAAYLLVLPGLALAGLIVWFHLSRSTAGRLCALTLVASPVLFVLLGLVMTGIGRLLHPAGTPVVQTARPDSLATVEAAVLRDDAAGVTAAAAAVGLRGRREGAGVIVLALHRLEKSPGQLPVFRALLDAGADPNGGYGELPLEVAIRVSPGAGPEPVALLLDAGAKPDAVGPLGVPAFFAATTPGVDVALLGRLLDRGAGVNTRAVDGSTALTRATAAKNWPAALLLLRRGAISGLGPPGGPTFQEMVEAALRQPGAEGELEELRRYILKK